MPVIATVYTPATVGLSHDMTKVDTSNDINVVICVLSAVFVAVYTILDDEQ